MASLRRELTNVPNLVTMSRVVLIPFVLTFIDNFSPLRSFIASLLYLICAAGDGLDGYLARKRGERYTLRCFRPIAQCRELQRSLSGHYVYAGRSDDMLKVSGMYVSPAEVESALISHPAVLEAAVVG